MKLQNDIDEKTCKESLNFTGTNEAQNEQDIGNRDGQERVEQIHDQRDTSNEQNIMLLFVISNNARHLQPKFENTWLLEIQQLGGFLFDHVDHSKKLYVCGDDAIKFVEKRITAINCLVDSYEILTHDSLWDYFVEKEVSDHNKFMTEYLQHNQEKLSNTVDTIEEKEKEEKQGEDWKRDTL